MSVEAKNSMFKHSYLGNSDRGWVLHNDNKFPSIVSTNNKICRFLVLLMIQSPGETHCTTRLKRHSTMSTPQNDNR